MEFLGASVLHQLASENREDLRLVDKRVDRSVYMNSTYTKHNSAISMRERNRSLRYDDRALENSSSLPE